MNTNPMARVLFFEVDIIGGKRFKIVPAVMMIKVLKMTFCGKKNPLRPVPVKFIPRNAVKTQTNHSGIHLFIKWMADAGATDARIAYPGAQIARFKKLIVARVGAVRTVFIPHASFIPFFHKIPFRYLHIGIRFISIDFLQTVILQYENRKIEYSAKKNGIPHEGILPEFIIIFIGPYPSFIAIGIRIHSCDEEIIVLYS